MDLKAAEKMMIEPDISMHIRDFAPWVLTGAFINEIV